MLVNEILKSLEKGEPFKDLSGVKLVGIEAEPMKDTLDSKARPDVVINLDFSGTRVTLYGLVKSQITPKSLNELSYWIRKLNSPVQKGFPYILICAYLSPKSQRYCLDNDLGFIDMCGNVSINVPGKVFIRRLDQANIYKTDNQPRNPFGGASSRVLRVLLNAPKRKWSVGDIYYEISMESSRNENLEPFTLSLSSVSKTIDALSESLLVQRELRKLLVLDPNKLLFEWAEKYVQRYRFMRRASWTCKNPFGLDYKESLDGLLQKFPNANIAVTGTAAANLKAPYVNVDRIDVYALDDNTREALRAFANGSDRRLGPDFLFMTPYDRGVAMYPNIKDNVKAVSDIQSYLDCYARGGRDAEQAEYLLKNVIEPGWRMNDQGTS